MVDSKRWGVHVSQCRVSLRIVFWGGLSPARRIMFQLCVVPAYVPREGL